MQEKPFSLYKSFILQAIAGGVTAVQLREKNKTTAEMYDLALALKTILAPLKVALIINDHVAIAKEIDADGLHLGQADIAPETARQLLGPDKIIGWSVETFAELDAANQLTCIDYVAASAVFSSKTKTNCKTMWGIAGLKQITKISRHPVIAIGGINAKTIKATMASGAYGVAVVSAIHDAANPNVAAADLIHEINRYAK